MLTFLFTILMLYIGWKLVLFALQATWGLMKIIFCVLGPVILIVLAIAGIIYGALPLVIIVAVIAAVVSALGKVV